MGLKTTLKKITSFISDGATENNNIAGTSIPEVNTNATSSAIKPTTITDLTSDTTPSETKMTTPKTNTSNADSNVKVRDYILDYGKKYGISNDDITWKQDSTKEAGGDVYLNGQYLTTPTQNVDGSTYMNQGDLVKALISYEKNNNPQIVSSNNSPATVETSSKPTEFTSKYNEQINNYLDKILNQGEFEYNVNDDPQFAYYKEMYNRLGEKAFKDSIGNLSPATNGQTNSWATTSANQSKQGYNEKLMDIVPELENNAYNRHNNEVNAMVEKLQLLKDQDNSDYNKYRDLISDYNTEKTYDRSVYENDRNYDKEVEESDRAYNYQVSRDNVLNEQWLTQFNESQRQALVNESIQKRQVSVSEGNLALNKANALEEKESADIVGQFYNKMMTAEDPQKYLIDNAETLTTNELKILNSLLPTDEDVSALLKELLK